MDNHPSLDGSKETDGEHLQTFGSSAPSVKSHQSSLQAPRQNGIPPKRHSTAAQRPSEPSTHSTVTASTSALNSARSAAHRNPTTRPTTNSSTRRPTSAATTTEKSTTERSATNPSEIKSQRAGTGTLDGTKRLDVSRSSKRISIPTSTFAKIETKPPRPVLGREYLSAAGTILETKSGLIRTSSASPTKGRQHTSVPSAGGIDRPTTSQLRTSTFKKTTTTSTAGASRPTKSNTMAGTDQPWHLGASNTNITPRGNSQKRIGTIQALPNHSTLNEQSTGAILVEPTKAIRPGLGTRKSTMSVSIKQRLREMELVHQMLNAAMDENSSDTDETKEGYVKKADEHLASLKVKFEEVQPDQANSSEKSMLDRSPSVYKKRSDSITVTQVEDTDNLGADHVGEPQHDDKYLDSVARPVRTSPEMDMGTRSTITECMKADHTKDVYNLRSQLEDAQRAAETLAQKNTKHILEYEAAKTQELNAINAELAIVQIAYKQHLKESSKDLEDLRIKNDSIEAEFASLNSKSMENTAKMQNDYAKRISEAEDMASHYAKENERLGQVLKELDDAKCKLVTTVEEKDEALQAKHKIVVEQETEIEDLMVQRTWAKEELNAYGARLMAKEVELREALVANSSLQKYNNQLEEKIKADSESFQTRMQAKADESEGVAKVIEHLQNTIKELQIETREANTANVTMQEHVRGLQKQVVADSESFEARIRAKVEELGDAARVAEHLQNYATELQETASTAARSCSELTELVKVKDIGIAELTAICDSSKATIRELKVCAAAHASSYMEEISLKAQNSEDLRLENEELRGCIGFTEDAMDAANEEIHHLNEVVKDLQDMIGRVHITTDRNLDDMRAKLIQEHEDIVEELRLNHLQAKTTFAKNFTNAEEEHEKALLALARKHYEEFENKETTTRYHVAELVQANTEAHQTAKDMLKEAQASVMAHEPEKTALLDQLSAQQVDLAKEVGPKYNSSIAVSAQSELPSTSNAKSLGSENRNVDELLGHPHYREAYECLQSDHRSVLDELENTKAEFTKVQAFTPPAGELVGENTTTFQAQYLSGAEGSTHAMAETQNGCSGAGTHPGTLEEADGLNITADFAEELEFFDELCILEHLGATKRKESTDVTMRLQALRDEIARAEELVMRSVPEGWLEACTESDARKLIIDALGEEECPRLRHEIRKLKAILHNIVANGSMNIDPQAKIMRISASSFDSALTGGWGYQALQAAADAQRETNAKLVEELRAAKKSNHILESELKENELDQNSITGGATDTGTQCSDITQCHLGGFAIMADAEDGKEDREGLGPRIAGRVAGLQEQIGQMRAEIDEDMVRTSKMYNKLGPTLVTSPVRQREVSDKENFLPKYSP